MFRLLQLLVTCLCCARALTFTLHCDKYGLDEPDLDFNGTYTCSTMTPRDYILPRIPAINPGAVTSVNLVPGKIHFRITIATSPPIFEIPEFLSAEECEAVKTLAVAKEDLAVAGVFGDNGTVFGTEEEYAEGVLARVSQTTFLSANSDPVLQEVQRRASVVSGMPLELLEESESYQIGYYSPGGHYHSHYDSSETSDSTFKRKRCCHQMHGPHTATSCFLCRYITILVYLNDVEEGGETAFPLSGRDDLNLTALEIDLSTYCQNASLVVKPKRGTAVMWYNNIRDEETGWLGPADPRSLHGGCDVIRGEKWIMNVWISAAQYEWRGSNSFYAERWA